MHIGAPRRRLSHLWQLPLLVLSLVLFFTTACLYVDARPTINLNQKLSAARQLLHNDRPDAAADVVNRLMTAEQLPAEAEGQVHLLLAEALDAAQKLRKQSIPANHLRIIEQTQIALAQGVRPTGDIHRRMGESYEALGKPVEAVGQYRQAIAMDPARALRLQRKVIDLQLAQSDWAPAESSIDAYLAAKDIADSERAWALSVKAQLLIDRGEFVGAKGLLEQALRLDNDPIASGEARFRLGVCAWKLGKLDEAVKSITAARGAFRGHHPLDADAMFALGQIAQEKNDLAGAIGWYGKVIDGSAESEIAARAQLSRGRCRAIKGDDDAGALKDLSAAATVAATNKAMCSPTVEALKEASDLLVARRNYVGVIELLALEQSVEPDSASADFFARRAQAWQGRADQIEQSLADAAGAGEKVRRQQSLRDAATHAGDAYFACSKARLAASEKGYEAPLWKAIDLYDRAANPAGAVAALELFVTEQADDPVAPDALLRLARTHETGRQADNAISAYGRLRGAYPTSLAAIKAAMPLAMLLERSSSPASARRVLAEAADDPQFATRLPEDFRAALFELGSLAYRAGDLKEATARLERFVERFPRDEKLGAASFLLGQSYLDLARQQPIPLAAGTDDKSAAAEMERAAVQRKQRLFKAAAQFARCAEIFASQPPTGQPEREYQMLAELRRADCAYELGDYDGALAGYQVLATRWPAEPVALAASVQIVNVYRATNKLDDARTAGEHVRVLLAKMPGAAFSDGPEREGDVRSGKSVMDPAYWEQWLKWSGMATASTW
jgi:tetratricopeptide (TPR) repeat protein